MYKRLLILPAIVCSLNAYDKDFDTEHEQTIEVGIKYGIPIKDTVIDIKYYHDKIILIHKTKDNTYLEPSNVTYIIPD